MGKRIMLAVTVTATLLASRLSLSGQEGALNLVRNPGFELGTKAWHAAWGGEGPQVVTDEKRAHSGAHFLLLTADNENVGVDNAPIYAAMDFDPNEQHIVSAYVSNLGVSRGGFGLRFYCYDSDHRYIAMRGVGDINPESPKVGWQKIEARVGPGTDFEFPRGVDHIVVRFSFWRKEQDCSGKVLVDDVFFGPVEAEIPTTTRKFRRTEKGSVAIWKDEVPVVGAASDPDYLGGLLEKDGFGVNFISTRDMTDYAILNARNFDLLILPYGECYPAPGAGVICRFLKNGGSFVSLGGHCFREPLYPSSGGWARSVSMKSNSSPPRPMVNINEALALQLGEEMNKGQQPAKVSLTKDSAGRPALRVVVPDLKTYKYIPFTITGSEDYTVIHLRARGDEDTKHLCVEMNEADDSRWKAVVSLSTEWREYEISTGEFVSYATESRGGRGDYLRAERAKRIAFGFPTSLVGKGDRSFEISNIQWRASDASPKDFIQGSVLFKTSSDLDRAFGAQLRYAVGFGDVTAFFGSQEFGPVPRFHAALDQFIFPGDLSVKGRFEGWTTTILEDNLYRGKSHYHQFLPSEKLARTIPLLLTPEGDQVASLFINIGGKYRGSLWACFGVSNRDLFSPDDAKMGTGFVSLADRMLCGTFLDNLEPHFLVKDGRARMEAMVEISNRASRERTFELHSRLLPLHGTKPLAEKVLKVSLAAGEAGVFLALEADAERFDWKHFKVECRLLSDGNVVDAIETSLDTRGTLLAICDRFVETQKERGDGKFSGIAFVDNRGTRGLLAAYDLTGEKKYLDAAMAWGNVIVAEQREDGGYLMGYGYHPEGDSCYVADGGEIACGIARLITYAPQKDKKRFMDSLRKYMAYRDSFRCEGGGIGVGWCWYDYGVRPIKKLDKVTRIYAPEMNIYTIGCTLTAATMYALLTKDEKDNRAAVEDAHWWMERCKTMSGGAFVESAIWANKFLHGGNIKKDTEELLREKFIPNVIGPKRRWWTMGAGRTVQGLDGLAYYYDCIEKDPEVLATLMRAAYHVCSPEAISGIPRILSKSELNQSEWIYLNFASVSLPDLLQPEIIRKPF